MACSQSVRERLPLLRTVIVHGTNANRGIGASVDALVPWGAVLAAAEKLAASPPPAPAPTLCVDVPLSALVRVLREEGLADLAAQLDAAQARAWVADLRPAHDVCVTLRPAVPETGGESGDVAPPPPASGAAAGRGSPSAAMPRQAAPAPRRAPQPPLRPSMLSAGGGSGSGGSGGDIADAAPWFPHAAATSTDADAAAVADLADRVGRQLLGGGALQTKKPSAPQVVSWVVKAEAKTPEAPRLPEAFDDPQLPPLHSSGSAVGIPVSLRGYDAMPLRRAAPPTQQQQLPQHPPRGPVPPRSTWPGDAELSRHGSHAPGSDGSDGGGDGPPEHDWASLVPHPSIRLNNPETNPLYKTQLCKHWMQSGQCKFGPACGFAHGSSDLRPYAGGGGGSGPGAEAEAMY